MKKIICVLLVIVCAGMLAACGGNPSGGNNYADMDCQQIIEQVYETAEKTEQLEAIMVRAQFNEITAENSYWFLGTDAVNYESGVASESPISPSNYSFCVIKLPAGSDYEAAEKLIEDNIDPMKWVCMGADVAYVERVDNVIAVILADTETADSLKAAFLA